MIIISEIWGTVMNSRENWNSYSHETLYARIHGQGGFFLPDGAGVSGATGAQEGWAELASLMAQARERTEAALTRAGAEWEGGAADAMRSGVTPLAQWADDAHTASAASADSTDTHVSSYSAARNKMPEPVPVTSTANSGFLGIPSGFTHLFGGQTDQDRQEAAAQEAKAEAVRVMSGYEVESSAAQASVGRFVPPPSVTVDVPPPRPQGGDGIPVGVSEWPRAGRAGDDGVGDPSAVAPPPGGTSDSTSPSTVTAGPPSGNPPAGLGADQPRPGSSSLPAGGISGLGTGGRGSGTTTGRGSGSTSQGPNGAGRGSSGTGRGSSRPGTAEAGPGGAKPGPGAGSSGGTRGAVPGGPVNENTTGRPGKNTAGGMGVGPVGGGRADGDEDKEHTTAEYLRGTHDSFWDDAPPVAPAVIGDEDDD